MTDQTFAYGSRLPEPDARPDIYAGARLSRALAWVLDVFIVGVICTLLLPFTAFIGIFFFAAMMLVVGFFYRWWTLAARSATWGMRFFGIQIRRLDGRTLTGGEAFLHTLGYSVSVVMAPAQLISVCLMGVTPRGQGLTDLVLGTTAVNRPV